MSRGLYDMLRGFYDLAEALERRSALPSEKAHRVDRDAGAEIDDTLANPEQLFSWAEKMAEGSEGFPGASFSSRYRMFLGGLSLLGMLLGALFSAGVFAYDGTRPVNVLFALTAFAILPLLFLLFSLLAMLPRRLARLIPGFSLLQDSLLRLSPGRALTLVSRRLPQNLRDGIRRLAAKGAKHRVLFARTERCLVFIAGQVFGVWFYFSALIFGAYLVVTSDIAFTWSTTLDVSEEELHAVTSFLSAPWFGAAPHAVPSLELIRISRYFRLHEGVLPGAAEQAQADPADLGGWWPFLLMSLLCYGLMPRLLLFAAVRARLRGLICRSAVLLPGADLVLQAMRSEYVSSSASSPETPRGAVTRADDSESLAEMPLGGCVLIQWASAGGSRDSVKELLRRKGLNCSKILSAGDSLEIEAERRQLASLASIESSLSVAVAVKGWEPPTEDLLDFLRALRGSLGKGRPVYVLAFGRDAPNSGNLSANLPVWRRAIASIGDPWLSLVGAELAEVA